MAGLRTRARGYALQLLYSLDLNAGAPGDSPLLTTRDHCDVSLESEGEEFARRILDSGHQDQSTRLGSGLLWH